MANDFNKILELANKNNMGLSNTIKRDYGIPLDYSSVQETYEAALAYAQTSTLAYIGQPISVGDTLYIVTDEANGYLKAVGTKPTGDEGSITVDEAGKISIAGFATAGSTCLPRVKITTDDSGNEVSRSIEWVSVDAIVDGDGNTKTEVKVAEDSAITVIKTRNEETDTDIYTLDVTLPAIPEVPEYSVEKESGEGVVTYRLTKDGTAVGEDIVVPNAYDDTSIDDRLKSVEASVEDHQDRISDIEDKVDTFFAAVENPDEVVDTLAEIQKYIADDKTGAAGMLESITANTEAIEILNGEGTGSVTKTVNDAIAAQVALDTALYATQAALEAVKATADAAAVQTEVETALENKADKTSLNNYYTKDETYTKEAVDALLDGITADTGATATQVESQLNVHKTESATKFEALNAKNDEQDTAIQTNASAIAAINNETTGILAKATAAAALDAQSRVDTLGTTVSANTAAIAAVETKITGANDNISSISGRVGALEQADINITNSVNALSGAHDTLVETVSAHTTEIKALQDKDIALDAAILANTNNFSNYSTTTEVEAKIEAAITGISYKNLEDAIAANTTAITTESERAVAKENELAGLIASNTTAINTNASEILRLDGVLTAALENNAEGLDSIKELAVWIEDHESEVLPSIQANTDAIAALKGDGDGSIQQIVSDAIANIPATPIATTTVAGIVKASEDISVSADGTMLLNEGVFSTDRLVQGNNTLVLNGGTANVAAVTD